VFVVLGHNTTELFAPTAAQAAGWITNYTFGLQDVPLVFFYFLISIVIHAVIQEFALDVSIRICLFNGSQLNLIN
jgi:translocating chain-associated membrane protein 1